MSNNRQPDRDPNCLVLSLEKALDWIKEEKKWVADPPQSWSDRQPNCSVLVMINAEQEFDDFAKTIIELPETLRGKLGEETPGLILFCGQWRLRTRGARAMAKAGKVEDETSWDLLLNNEFFLRMFQAYDLGLYVAYVDLAAHLERLRAFPLSIPDGSEGLFRPLLEELDLWANDVEKLRLLGSNYVEKEKKQAAITGTFDDRRTFLTHLAALYQLGRRGATVTDKLVMEKIEWLRCYPGSYNIRQLLSLRNTTEMVEFRKKSINDRLAKSKRMNIISNDLFDKAHVLLEKERDQLVSDATLLDRLVGYEICRDMARCLSTGVARWAERSRRGLGTPNTIGSWEGEAPAEPHPRQARQEPRPPDSGTVRVLICDEGMARSARKAEENDEYHGRFLKRIQGIFQHSFRDQQVEVDCVVRGRSDETLFEQARLAIENDTILNNVWSLYPGETSKVRPQEAERRFSDYQIILLDVEFDQQFVGTSFIRLLLDHFDSTRPRQPGDGEKLRGARPRIIVFSWIEHARLIQQCFSQGADAYADKRRLFALPYVLSFASVEPGRAMEDLPAARSNFQILDTLLPEDRNRLRSTAPLDRVIGDELDRLWIQALPKADLHFHIGTSISLKTIVALAWNTAGYLLPRRPEDRLSLVHSLLVDRVVRIALLTHVLGRLNLDPPVPDRTAKALWHAAVHVLGPVGKLEKGFEGFDDKAYDRIIDELTPPDRPFHRFEVCALLVAALTYVEHIRDVGDTADIEGLKEKLKKPWQYLEELHKKILGSATGAAKRQVSPDPSVAGQSKDPWLSLLSHRSSRLLRRIYRILWELIVLPKLSEKDTKTRTLEDTKTRTLERYLRGAGLLGAEHLQYPENLVLAAEDLVRQALDDNIVYSEVRCATTGYTKGGMDAMHATDVLCLGFDLAAFFHALPPGDAPDTNGNGRAGTRGHDSKPRRWVRTNVLLGAKRHKTKREFKDLVALLSALLARGESHEPDPQRRSALPARAENHEPDPQRRSTAPPSWWRPCRVVGFDMSGVEQKDDEPWVPEEIEPLRVQSAPITIHAGEAASADKIWEAVHRYGARRIGHGLRLREETKLLGYCIAEGICMELCPLSNRFTNLFEDVLAQEGRADRLEPDPYGIRRREIAFGREYYPLANFLDAGLDACVNTDNRSLHRRFDAKGHEPAPPTDEKYEPVPLTDDYLAAAQLVGGLTRWEVLRIVKAGFKHAFLPKVEIKALLRHVEAELYNLISGPVDDRADRYQVQQSAPAGLSSVSGKT